MHPRYLFILFFIILLLHASFIYLHADTARAVSKALLMPVLIASVFFTKHSGNHKLQMSALFLSWCGDLLLIGKGELFFIFGLVCFLAAHVVYIFQFIRIRSLRNISVLKAAASLLLPIILVSFVLHYTWNALGALRYPVLLYISVISFMFVAAANTYSFPKQNILIAAGAKLFLFSDALLALQMFYLKEDIWSIPVMLLYGAAQFCLTKGILHAQQTTDKKTVIYADR